MSVQARYGLAFLAVVGVAVGLALWWPADGEARRTALVAVALCAGSGALSLAFKRSAKSLNGALLVVVAVFGFRALLVTVGGVWAVRYGGGAMPFVLGFFGTFMPLMAVEIGFLLARAKQDDALRGR